MPFFPLTSNLTELFPLEKEGRAPKFSGVFNAINLFRRSGGRTAPEADTLLKIINYISDDLNRLFTLSCNFAELFPLKMEGRELKFSGVVNARNLYRGPRS